MIARPGDDGRQPDVAAILEELVTSPDPVRRHVLVQVMEADVTTAEAGIRWVRGIRLAVGACRMHPLIAEYIVGYLASFVAGQLARTDNRFLALNREMLALDLEYALSDLGDDQLASAEQDQVIDDEDADELNLTPEQLDEWKRREDEIEDRRSRLYDELEFQVLGIWGEDLMIEVFRTDFGAYARRAAVGRAMVFGEGVWSPDGVPPIWFAPER